VEPPKITAHDDGSSRPRDHVRFIEQGEGLFGAGPMAEGLDDPGSRPSIAS
jgi:hypothetical protein